MPLVRAALDGADGAMWTRHPALAITLAAELWDTQTHASIIEWLMKHGRESGSPLVLCLGLAQTATHAAMTGDLDRAMAAVAEEEAITDATGVPSVMYHRLHLAAMRGRREEALALFETATATARSAGQFVGNVHWAQAVLNNGLADYPAALAAAAAPRPTATSTRRRSPCPSWSRPPSGAASSTPPAPRWSPSPNGPRRAGRRRAWVSPPTRVRW